MRDELFDHLKHKLAETEVPDPDKGWKLMSTLLNTTARPRPVVLLRRWYAAAACLILAGAAWALVHEMRSSREKVGALQAQRGSGVAHATPTTPAGAGGASAGGAAASDRTASSGNTAPGQTTATDATAADAAGATTAGATRLTPGPGRRTAASHTGSTRAVPSDVVASTAGVSTAGVSTAGVSTVGASTPGASTANMPGDPGILRRPDPACNCTTTWSLANSADLKQPSPNVLNGEKPLMASLRPLAPTMGPIRPAHHNRWGFDLGIGANLPGSLRTVTVNNQSKWEPGLYPIFTARYRLTPRVSLKVGVAGPSPVAFSKTLSQKNLNIMDSAYVNYTSSSVSSSSTKIGRLQYMDIPVSLQWTATRHLNLEAGLQYSRLLSEQDDTRSTVTPLTNLALYYAPALAVSSDDQPQVKKTDVRYFVGANYTWHRFSAGVQYQGGLQHSVNQVDDQGNTMNSHTSIAKMQIMYSLR